MKLPVVASSWDATVGIWDLSTGKSQTYFDFETTAPIASLWGPSDLYVFTAQGKDIKLWELDTRSAVRDFIGHQDVIGSLQP